MILELRERGAKNVVLKGIEHGDGLIHNYVWGDAIDFTETTNAKLPYMLHGTGDVFASTLLAAVMAGLRTWPRRRPSPPTSRPTPCSSPPSSPTSKTAASPSSLCSGR